MTVDQIGEIYREIFGKFLHVKLELCNGTKYTEEFKRLFKSRWNSREVAFSTLVGTCLDNNRWKFGDDLSLKLMSVPEYDQISSSFTHEVILAADIEKDIKNFSLYTILRLRDFIPKSDRKDFVEYVEYLKEDNQNWGW